MAAPVPITSTERAALAAAMLAVHEISGTLFHEDLALAHRLRDSTGAYTLSPEEATSVEGSLEWAYDNPDDFVEQFDIDKGSLLRGLYDRLI